MSTTWTTSRSPAFLLKETLEFLLLETGDKIRLEEFGVQTVYSVRQSI